MSKYASPHPPSGGTFNSYKLPVTCIAEANANPPYNTKSEPSYKALMLSLSYNLKAAAAGQQVRKLEAI